MQRDAALDLGALERHLAQADVVDRLDALAPRVDLRLVDVAGGGGVLEEQRQRQALVDVLRGRGVGVDDLLVADLVRVLVVLQVVVRHERRRVVDAADLAFLADLDLRRDRVDRARRVVDVRDRAGRRHGLQVLVVDAVLLDRTPSARAQSSCVGMCTPASANSCLDLLGLRLPRLVGVLVEELARRVLRVLEAVERRAALDRDAGSTRAARGTAPCRSRCS